MLYPQVFSKTVLICAPAEKLWHMLTTPDLMKVWMTDVNMTVEVNTDWRVGGPIVIGGDIHGIAFENRGTVVRFDAPCTLEYSHLSSLSNLSDSKEHYSMILFGLVAEGEDTMLTLTVRNFPSESIYKHLLMYWRPTLDVLKNMLEQERK